MYNQEKPSFSDSRTVAESQKRYRQNERSGAKESQYGYEGQSRQQASAALPLPNNSIDLTDLQFEQMCDEFFANGPPIKFRARRGVKLDELIQKILRKE